MGQKLTHMESGILSLTGKFRDHLRCKLLVVADELSMNKEDYLSLWDTLKNTLSALYLILEGKYIRKFKIRNLFYAFLFTNRNNAVFVEDMDRRFDFNQLSEKHMQDRAFFEELKRTCFNEDTANHFFTWLVKTDEFEDVDPGERVNNMRRKQAIESCLPAYLYFLGLLKQAYKTAEKLDAMNKERQAERKIEATAEPTKEQKSEAYEPEPSLLDVIPVERRIMPSELFKLYKRWSEEAGEKNCLSQRKFKEAIRNHITKYKYKGQIYYYIDTVKIDLTDSDVQVAPDNDKE